VTAPDLVDRLAAHKTVGAAPRDELAWLASHGSLRQLNEGEMLSAKGVPVAPPSILPLRLGSTSVWFRRCFA
jgi:hypothetical protein